MYPGSKLSLNFARMKCFKRIFGNKKDAISSDMKYLVVGLGNPGPEYKDTRHNIGFSVLDKIADDGGASFKTEQLGDLAHVKFRGRSIYLLKPSTYMNLSGKAVRYWLQKLKIPADHLLIVVDDIHLPFGKLRMRTKGSDGGHNGLKDIIHILGSEKFNRLRIGIGSKAEHQVLTDHVLGEWSEAEKKELTGILSHAAEMAKLYTHIGVSRAMSRVNSNKSKDKTT